ncbi:cytochrome ubiquinol oxidase subunit I, partial [Amycolatopsis sp. NPDC003865]
PFIWNVFKSYRYGEIVTVDDPWGYGNSLEWATSCPPPRHNFTELPRIRSERPAFELHYPHMIERIHNEGEIGFFGKQKVNSHAAPSQLLTEAVIPGDHSRDNASEQGDDK